MANLNKVMLIGRLTRDPEVRTFATGGRVAAFGFAVNIRKRNPDSGAWEEEPVFLDCKAYDRDNGRRLAELVERYLAKGRQAYIEGHLVLEKWTSKQDGQQRSKLVIVVDDVQFLDRRPEDGPGGSGASEGGGTRVSRMNGPSRKANTPAYESEGFDEPEMGGGQDGPRDEDIPF